MNVKFKSNQKLWSLKHDTSGFYYEIRLAGTVMDKFYINEEMTEVYKKLGVIK